MLGSSNAEAVVRGVLSNTNPHAGNLQKGFLFRKCYARAQRAIKAGFYLEAVSLCESLILDRLAAILANNLEGDFRKFSVGKAANNLISHKVIQFDNGLWQDCMAWSKHRNLLSHKMASLQEAESSGWNARLKLARDTANSGLRLANRCSKEAKKHKI